MGIESLSPREEETADLSAWCFGIDVHTFVEEQWAILQLIEEENHRRMQHASSQFELRTRSASSISSQSKAKSANNASNVSEVLFEDHYYLGDDCTIQERGIHEETKGFLQRAFHLEPFDDEVIQEQVRIMREIHRAKTPAAEAKSILRLPTRTLAHLQWSRE